MRLSRSLAPVTLAAALLLSLPCGSAPHARASDGKPHVPDLFGSSCRTAVHGSHVVSYCHNPYVGTDRVSLHIECARWWDIDTDGTPVEAGPAQTVRLTGRCWADVRSAWVSHQKVS